MIKYLSEYMQEKKYVKLLDITLCKANRSVPELISKQIEELIE